MRSLLILLYTMLPSLVISQNYLLEFDKFNSEHTFDWRGLEVNNAYKEKQKFVQHMEETDGMSSHRSLLDFAGENLIDMIKAVDINNDKLSDIIYCGRWGGDGTQVIVSIQKDGGYEPVFTARQGITKVVWKGNLLDKVFLRDWGCCADPTLQNSVFQVSYDDGVPEFDLIWKSVELEGLLSKPKTLFDHPKRFEVTNEKYKMRANPWIDDTQKIIG